MSKCKPNLKYDQNSKFDFSAITNILNLLLTAFRIGSVASKELPPYIMLLGVPKNGLSCRRVTAHVINGLEEIGLPMGDVFADGPNKTAQLTKTIMCEIVNEFTQNGAVSAVIGPGDVQITVASPVGPLQGSNLLPFVAKGGIQ